ncbi:MAG: transcription antitermination factor NusB [Thermomicrobiales bacterium]
MSDHSDPHDQPTPTDGPSDVPDSAVAPAEASPAGPAATPPAKKRRSRNKGKAQRRINAEQEAARKARYLTRRHHGRVLAMQMLFEQDVAQHDLDEILDRMRTDPDEPVPTITGDYAIKVTTGIRESRETIDARIARAAPAFPIGQLSSIDRNVMRIAIWEMETNEVPVRVAINEAIEIAKHYGGPSSGKFVNGVLGTIARELSQERAAQDASEAQPATDDVPNTEDTLTLILEEDGPVLTPDDIPAGAIRIDDSAPDDPAEHDTPRDEAEPTAPIPLPDDVAPDEHFSPAGADEPAPGDGPDDEEAPDRDA